MSGIEAWIKARRDLLDGAPGRWDYGVVGHSDGQTVAEWLRDTAVEPDAPAAGRLWVVWRADAYLPDGALPIPATTGDGPSSEARAAAIVDAHTALPAALAALEQVLALHPAGEHPTSSHYYCEPYECDQAGDGELLAHCDVCREWWPCSTVTAITQALGVEP